MDIEFGLIVTYDGKSYTLLCPDHIKEYPVGGLICEYCSISPAEIKAVILQCNGLEEKVTADNLANTIVAFHEKLFEVFPPVAATMISLEFQNATQDWMKAIRDNVVEEFIEQCYSEIKNVKILDYVFDGTPYKDIGCTDVFQVMLSSYYSFSQSYVHLKYMFTNILGEGETEQRERVLNLYHDLYGELMDMQHIDFRFVAIEGKGLTSLYTIKSSISLLIFEMAHAQQTDQQFVKCANCGKIFVPEGRSDTIYCSYPSPNKKEKTCKEVGAQIARSNKEKTDIVTGSYRKVYMRYQMMTKRHPRDKEKRELFDKLTTGMKEWRVKLSNGTATAEDVLCWLEQF